MEKTVRNIIVPAFVAATVLLPACGKSTPDTPVKPIAGREETQGIRRTDAIGYSGSAIANKVDGALNANDRQMEKTDQALKDAE